MNFKAMRKRAGFTQEEAASALSVATVTYGNWERETNSPSFDQAVLVADLFNCSLDELAGREHRVAEVVPMNEPPLRARVRSAFDSLNHAGREALAETADCFLRVPAFTCGGGRDYSVQAAAV